MGIYILMCRYMFPLQTVQYDPSCHGNIERVKPWWEGPERGNGQQGGAALPDRTTETTAFITCKENF